MKNKGIAIELTALLDVILIMLFWVMMSMEHEKTTVREEAAETIARQQEEFELRESELTALFDKQKTELTEELDTVKERYEQFIGENAESAAVANQKALDEFAEGRLITLNLSYDAVGTLYILDENGEIGHTLISSEKDIADKIDGVLKSSGLGRDDVILCAFVYDGSRALYRDVRTVTAAADTVGKKYGHFYCTYINISN